MLSNASLNVLCCIVSLISEATVRHVSSRFRHGISKGVAGPAHWSHSFDTPLGFFELANVSQKRLCGEQRSGKLKTYS